MTIIWPNNVDEDLQLSHRAGVSSDCWGCLQGGSSSWSRLLATPQHVGVGHHTPFHPHCAPRVSKPAHVLAAQGQGADRAGHLHSPFTLPWATPQVPNRAQGFTLRRHWGSGAGLRHLLNMPKEGERQQKEIKKMERRNTEIRRDTCRHRGLLSQMMWSYREGHGVGGRGDGTGKRGKTEGPGEEGRCTAPSLGAQQQAGPKRSELLGVI